MTLRLRVKVRVARSTDGLDRKALKYLHRYQAECNICQHISSCSPL